MKDLSVPDILIPDVPEDVIAAIDIKAQRLGISRADYLRRVLVRELAVQTAHVAVTDLDDFAGAFADLSDIDAMNRAWRGTQPGGHTADEESDGRTTIGEVKQGHLAAMTTDERAVFDETYGATRLALDIGEKVRDAREAANLSQRELAARMRIGQAAVARLEAGDVGATLTTLQKFAAGLDLRITIELSAAIGGRITDA